MSRIRNLACLAGLLIASFTMAQFPLVNSSNQTLQTIYSLDGGVRYIGLFEGDEQQRTIYNLDLSVHRVLNYPLPPAGMHWSQMIYITQALFDTDPATIEFLMVAAANDGPGNFAVFVFREDGTTLFEQNPGSLVSQGQMGVNTSQPIYAVEGQVYMMTYETSVFGPPTRTYALPGTLPCLDCYGSPGGTNSSTGVGPTADPGAGISVFPNPAADRLTVDLGRQHRSAGVVRLYDELGRLALEHPFAAAERVEVNVGALARGAFICQVFVGSTMLSSLPVLIER